MGQEFLQMFVKPLTKSHTENNVERCAFSLNPTLSTQTRAEMAFSLPTAFAILSQTRQHQNETPNNLRNRLPA